MAASLRTNSSAAHNASAPVMFQVRYFTSETFTSTHAPINVPTMRQAEKPVGVRIDEGLSISRTDKKPMPTSAAIKHATPSVESSTARFFNRRKQSASPAERSLCAGSGTGVSCSQRPPTTVRPA